MTVPSAAAVMVMHKQSVQHKAKHKKQNTSHMTTKLARNTRQLNNTNNQ